MFVHEEETINAWFLDPKSLGYHLTRDFLNNNIEIDGLWVPSLFIICSIADVPPFFFLF